MSKDSGGSARLSPDEVTQHRTRLTRRYAIWSSPFTLVGMLLLLFDVGPDRWQAVPLLVGVLISSAGWPVSAWRYPRQVGG